MQVLRISVSRTKTKEFQLLLQDCPSHLEKKLAWKIIFKWSES